MSWKTVAILGTGEMGSAIAACLAAKGIRLVSCQTGRSARSKDLASTAGIEVRDTIADMLSDADALLSIIPPSDAVLFAETMCPLLAAAGRDALFVDCNAISPDSVARVAEVAAANGVRFQDVGIVGASPRPGRTPVRCYTSGPFNAEMENLATDLIEVLPVGEQPGKASALKMVYASLTKGTHALRAAACIAALRLGVADEIHAEWQRSLPDVYAAMESRMPVLACVSGRWTGEMREIADTYASIELPRGFHQGAEQMYAALSQIDLAAESRDEARAKDRSLDDVIEQFTSASFQSLDPRR